MGFGHVYRMCRILQSVATASGSSSLSSMILLVESLNPLVKRVEKYLDANESSALSTLS